MLFRKRIPHGRRMFIRADKFCAVLPYTFVIVTTTAMDYASVIVHCSVRTSENVIVPALHELTRNGMKEKNMISMEKLLTQADFSKGTDRMNRLYTVLFQKPMPTGNGIEDKQSDRFEQNENAIAYH